MLFSQSKIEVQIGTLTSDRCARSGLASPIPADDDGGVLGYFATVYTTNFTEMRDFYKQVIGAEHVKIEGESLLVFEHGGGSVVLKQVEHESQFAKLVGKQSLGLVGYAPKLTGSRDEAVSEMLEWDTQVVKINDPDGNILLFAAPEEAKAVELARKTGT